MKNFDKAYITVIEHEGYYANVIGDKGGETYMGIARKIHPDWKGWKFIDDYKKNVGELKRNQKIESISLDALVEKFYYEKRWLDNGIHLIDNYNLKYIIFDWCVNSDWNNNGAKNVQRLVSATPDGIIGKNTAKAINSYDPKHLFTIIKAARKNYYNKIAVGQNAQFLKGWLKRINSINYEKTI